MATEGCFLWVGYILIELHKHISIFMGSCRSQVAVNESGVCSLIIKKIAFIAYFPFDLLKFQSGS